MSGQTTVEAPVAPAEAAPVAVKEPTYKESRAKAAEAAAAVAEERLTLQQALDHIKLHDVHLDNIGLGELLSRVAEWVGRTPVKGRAEDGKGTNRSIAGALKRVLASKSGLKAGACSRAGIGLDYAWEVFKPGEVQQIQMPSVVGVLVSGTKAKAAGFDDPRESETVQAQTSSMSA